MDRSTADEIGELHFEEAFTLLEEVLDEMRRDGLALERALALYERGTLLAAHCDTLLAGAELRLTELSASSSQGTAAGRLLRESLAESNW